MKKLIIVVMMLLALFAGMATALFYSPGMRDVLITDTHPASSAQQPSEETGWNLLRYWSDNINLPGKLSGPSSNVKELALTITACCDDDYNKMVAIYDWVTENIAYDLEKARDISAYGSGADYVLEKRRGVCHDYAQLTKELLLSVDIEATYEKGEVINSSGETELHAWNQAYIDNRWYALDTTWGAGFIFAENALFVQKPRRLYLTTIEELGRLHHNPDYKQKQEQEYMRLKALDQPVVEMPEYEKEIIQVFNSYRFEKELPLLTEELRLNELARTYAGIFTEMIAEDNEFTLEDLSEELSTRAAGLNIKSAAMHVMVKWFTHPEINGQVYDKIIVEHSNELDQVKWEGLSVGAVGKGDLIVFIFILIDYH